MNCHPRESEDPQTDRRLIDSRFHEDDSSLHDFSKLIEWGSRRKIAWKSSWCLFDSECMSNTNDRPHNGST